MKGKDSETVLHFRETRLKLMEEGWVPQFRQSDCDIVHREGKCNRCGTLLTYMGLVSPADIYRAFAFCWKCNRAQEF